MPSQTQKVRNKSKIVSNENDEILHDADQKSWFVMFKGDKNELVVSHMHEGKVTTGIAYKDSNTIVHE
jgi:hypothetical protein